MIERIIQDTKEWCRGRNGWVRIPLLLWFAYVFYRHLRDPAYQSILDPLNLGIHEFGHLVFMVCGEFMMFLGGTLMQIIAPLYGVYNFLKQRDYYSVALCFGWLSTNFYDIAVYVADARSQSLDLVTPFGGHAQHDWNFLLSRVNMLTMDHIFAGGFKLLAILSMLVCFTYGGWIVKLMITSKKG